jgi:hypothetical protein
MTKSTFKDIYFYFKLDNRVQIRRITSDFCETMPTVKVPIRWANSVLKEIPVRPRSSYFVFNLSLLAGGEPAASGSPQLPKDIHGGDLFIIPPHASDKAYHLTQADYVHLPLVPIEDVADLTYMALEEGIVIATPKLGYLLNLLATRTGAVTKGKTEVSSKLEEAMLARPR